MSTFSLEDRMDALERQHYNLQVNFTQLEKKLTTSTNQQPDYQLQLEGQINTRLDRMEERFHQIMPTTWAQLFASVRLEGVNARFEQIDARFEKVDQRFEKIETRLDRMEALLAQILERLPG